MCVCVCVDWIFDVLACRDCCVGFMCLLWHVLWFALSVVVVVASGWECQCTKTKAALCLCGLENIGPTLRAPGLCI